MNHSDIDTVTRKQALIDELETSIKLIKSGLREIQAIDGENDFYHILLLTLANGFERLMKVIICLYMYERDGVFPTKYPWDKNRNGHNLVFLLNYVAENCFYQKYVEKLPVAKSDIDYIKNNPKLAKHVEILSGFGKAARYYNLDVIKGCKPETSSPKEEWIKLEKEIIRENPDWRKEIQNDPNLNLNYKRVNKEIVIIFERFARSLSRLFTIGRLGDYAKQISGNVYPFLMLMDDSLGENSY